MQQTFTESPGVWKFFTIGFGLVFLLQTLITIYWIGEAHAEDVLFMLFYAIAYGVLTFFLIFLPKWVTPSIIAFTALDILLMILAISENIELVIVDYIWLILEIALVFYVLIANEAKAHIKFAGRYKKTTETTHGKSYSTTTISSSEDSWTSPQDVEPERDNLVEKGFKVIKKVKDK